MCQHLKRVNEEEVEKIPFQIPSYLACYVFFWEECIFYCRTRRF